MSRSSILDQRIAFYIALCSAVKKSGALIKLIIIYYSFQRMKAFTEIIKNKNKENNATSFSILIIYHESVPSSPQVSETSLSCNTRNSANGFLGF